AILRHAAQDAQQRPARNPVAAHEIGFRNLVGQAAREAVRGHALDELVILAAGVDAGLEVLIADGALEKVTAARHGIQQAAFRQDGECPPYGRPGDAEGLCQSVLAEPGAGTEAALAGMDQDSPCQASLQSAASRSILVRHADTISL